MIKNPVPVGGLARKVAVRADELLGALVLQLDMAVDVELVVVAVVAVRALDLARLPLQQLPPLVGLHVRLDVLLSRGAVRAQLASEGLLLEMYRGLMGA